MTTKYITASANASAAVWSALQGALTFNGTTQTGTMGNLDRSTFTIAFWVKRSRTGANGFVDRVIMSVNNSGFGVYFGSGGDGPVNAIILTQTGITSNGGTTTAYITDTNWHHVAITYDGSTVKTYIDGSLASTDSLSVTFDSSGGNYTLAGRNGAEFLGGTLADMRIASTVYDATAISNLYNGGIGTNASSASLVNWWKFSEGTGTSMADSAGSATVTLNNTPTWTTALTCSEPTTGDNADLNGKTLTVDQTFPASGSTTIIGATGTLAVSGNRTINANIGDASAGFSCTLTGSNQTVTINGNILAAITATRITLNGSTTTLTVTGNVTGGSGTTIRGILVTTGTLNVTGDVTGGSGSTAEGIRYNGGTSTITGNVTGGSAASASGLAVNSNTPSVTINGNVTGGSNGTAYGIMCSVATTTMTGNGVGATAPGILVNGGTLNQTGNLTGGSTNNVDGDGLLLSSGTVTTTGTVTGGSGTGTSTGTAPYGVKMLGGTFNLTGPVVDGSGTSAIAKCAGTFNYTPTTSQTYVTGGKTMYASPGIPAMVTNTYDGQEGVLAA